MSEIQTQMAGKYKFCHTRCFQALYHLSTTGETAVLSLLPFPFSLALSFSFSKIIILSRKKQINTLKRNKCDNFFIKIYI